MSIIRAIKHRLGLSVTPANNFVLTAEADDGTMKLARESGQDIMTVDAAGKVAFPQNATPAFSAYKSGTAQGIAGGSVQGIILESEEFDTNGGFASSVFTVPVAGIYQVTGQVGFSAGTGTGHAAIMLNGVPRIDGTDVTIGGVSNISSVSALLTLSVGSQLRLGAFSSTNINVNWGLSQTRLSGVLVRAA